MATASVTHAFANATTADATQVNTNFTDLTTFLNTNVVHKDGAVAMTGQLSLPASNPSTDNQAARKYYVDRIVPIGTVLMFSGSSAPTGWLLCYGQAASRTTYDELFAVIGTTYGDGDGSTTFNLPDLRGRVVHGLDNIGGSDAGRLSAANTLGGTGGSESISTSAMPSHTHSFSDTTSSAGSHQHGLPSTSTAGGGSGYEVTAARTIDWNAILAESAGSHTHSISGTTGSAGSGTAGGNLAPYILMNYIIRGL